MRRGGQRQVVTRLDIETVSIGSMQELPVRPHPRILHVVDESGESKIAGFYIRLPDAAFSAYGDLLPGCESRGVVWAGNRILYVSSDSVSAAFQYEVRVDELVTTSVDGVMRAEGAIELDRPLLEEFAGVYFPVPAPLERFLVPGGDAEIRLELHCEWIDMRTSRHWVPSESVGA